MGWVMDARHHHDGYFETHPRDHADVPAGYDQGFVPRETIFSGDRLLDGLEGEKGARIC